MQIIELFLIVFALAKIDLVKTTCVASVPTIRYVTSCPSNEELWREAELKKNCESLAEIQKCVKDPFRFKYHCLVNNYLNATLEVCAPIRFVSGYCADFNTVQMKVTENYEIDCTKLTPPCPPRYVSTDIYKYPSCYKVKEFVNRIDNSTLSTNYNMTQVSTTSDFENNKQHRETPGVASLIMGILLIIICCISILLLVYMIRRRYIYRKKSKFPLDDRALMFSLLSENATTSLASCPSDAELDKEDDDIENKTEWNGKYYRFVLKERSIIKEEEKDKKEAMELLVSLNEEATNNFLMDAKLADSFYEETKVYKQVENVFRTNSVVILTGPPGFGKTQTAIHLMMPFMGDNNWVIRKVENTFELNYIECAKNTIIFIDNMFYGKVNDFSEWMKPLQRLHIVRKSIEEKQNNSEESNLGKIKVIITAKSDIIEDVCDLISERSIFEKDCIVNLSEEQYELDNYEKKRILQRQFAFAEKGKGIPPPHLTDLFWEKVTKSKAHIGFPLCAHLFAFEEAYRRKGEEFFSWPTQLVFKQIEEVVTNDKTNRVKTLLLFLLLLEILNRDKDQETKYKLDLKNDKACSDFLKKRCRLGEHFQPLNFKDLPSIASELTWTFIRKGEHSYQFIHQSVYDAVERYIFRSLPIKSIALLPLNVIERQTNDKEDLTWFKAEHYKYLAKRFITEVKCGRSSHICNFEILRRTEFIQSFYDTVFKLENRDLAEFFTTKSVAFPQLPILFWLGRSKGTQLLINLISILESKKLENIFAEDHIYYSLFGECTIGENAKSLVSFTDDNSRDGIKNCVLSFRDNISNTILHIVIQSTSEDESAVKFVKQLIKDTIDINATNIYRVTPLMLAVTVTWPLSRKHVIKELVQSNCRVLSQDRKDNSAIHYCVLEDTDHDDLACSNILNILFGSKEYVDLSKSNLDGLTALNCACTNTRNSRILSICSMLAYGDSFEQADNKQIEETQSCNHGKEKRDVIRYSSEQVNKIDKEGKNPIFNAVSCLVGDHESVKLERLLRVCILLLYGADPHVKSDDGDKTAIAICKEKKYNDLEAIMSNANKNNGQNLTESLMIEAVKRELKLQSKTHVTDDHIEIKFSNKIKISDEMKDLISNAVKYLSKTKLNSSQEN